MNRAADGSGDADGIEAIGKHARSAVEMAELPFAIPIEIDMALQVE
jgi:hypothetical protein